jgi:anti-anti-sigma factor
MDELGQPASEGEGASTVHVEESVDPSGAPLLTLSGELDVSSADCVRLVVDRVTAGAPDKVIFDVAGLDFMDSSGIAILVIAAERVGTVEVRHPSRIIGRTIELSGLAGTLEITP